MTLKQFTIDEQFITSVSERKVWSMYQGKNPDELTPDELMKILKGEDIISSIESKDHPEFTRLREELGELGYIEIQRGWWNGDRVKKSFKLNEWTFRKGRQFSCASAMNNSIQCARKNGWKSIST